MFRRSIHEIKHIKTNHVIALCIQGSQAEYEKCFDLARLLYQQAWQASTDDFEACVAAHYMARVQTDFKENLRWNQVSLQLAQTADPKRIQNFLPSIYVNLGFSHEQLGNLHEARQFYDLAASLGLIHEAQLP